jgi:hypothetical protein
MHDENQTQEPPVTEADECGVLPSNTEIAAQESGPAGEHLAAPDAELLEAVDKKSGTIAVT